VNVGLVIGADSVLGEALLIELMRRGWRAMATSRRAAVDPKLGRFRLNLSQIAAGSPLEPIERAVLAEDGTAAAFIMAAVTGFERCSRDPSGSRQVNVEGTLTVARRLVANDIFVTFPSSSAVFEEKMTPLYESSPTAPETEYGRQKADCEAEMLRLNLGDSLTSGAAVVRFTKIVHSRDRRIRAWVHELRHGREIEVSAELKIAPVSLRHAVAALITIAEARRGGVYHVSGERALSYLDFARELALALGVDTSLVRPQPLSAKPPAASASALTVGPRSQALGLRAQAVNSVVRELIKDIEGER